MALHDTGVMLVGGSIFLAEVAHTHAAETGNDTNMAYASSGILSNNTNKWSHGIIHYTWMNLKNYYSK